jgi:hypothetical protein
LSDLGCYQRVLIFGYMNLMILIVEGLLLDKLMATRNKHGVILAVAVLALVSLVLGLFVLIVNDLILLNLVLVLILHLAMCGNLVTKVRLSRMTMSPRPHALRVRAVLIQMLLTVIVVI